jgi:hypothetical protein
MKILRLISTAIVGLGLSMAGSMMAASAAPATSGLASSEQTGAITRVAERDCIRDEKGWHYMEKDRRHSCRPKRPEGREWGWRCEGKRCGWWHGKEKRWND